MIYVLTEATDSATKNTALNNMRRPEDAYGPQDETLEAFSIYQIYSSILRIQIIQRSPKTPVTWMLKRSHSYTAFNLLTSSKSNKTNIYDRTGNQSPSQNEGGRQR